MQNCFNWGFFYGLVSAVILGFVWGKIQKCRGNIKKSSKPLDTIADAYQPKTTPFGVVKESIFSGFALIFWIPALGALFVGISWLLPHFRVSLGCG